MGISVGIQPLGGDDRLLVGVVVGCLLVQPMEPHPNLHMIFAPGFVLAILHGVVRALVRQAEMQLYVVYAGVHPGHKLFAVRVPHDGLGPGGALGGGQAPHLVGGHDIVIGGNVGQLDRILGGIRFAQVLSQRQAVVLGGEVLVHAQHHNAVVAHDCTADLAFGQVVLMAVAVHQLILVQFKIGGGCAVGQGVLDAQGQAVGDLCFFHVVVAVAAGEEVRLLAVGVHHVNIELLVTSPIC